MKTKAKEAKKEKKQNSTPEKLSTKNLCMMGSYFDKKKK